LIGTVKSMPNGSERGVIERRTVIKRRVNR
jgi:hypothetical protein